MPDDRSQPPCDLSVAVVCRDNEATIARVLDSVNGLASQLVVVDSGSKDRTLDIVRACEPWCDVALVQTEWCGHVATKQLALEACTRRHALALDSDEPVTPELAASVRDACARGVPAARVNRVVEYRGRLLEHCWQPEWRLRLVRTDLVADGRARWGGLDPHDKLIVEGERVEDLPGVLIHESFPSFEFHLGKQLKLQAIAARSLRDAGTRGSVFRLITSPPGAFLKQALIKGSWRDGRAGWLAAGTAAAGALIKHMVLLELTPDPAPEHQKTPDSGGLGGSGGSGPGPRP